MMEQLISSGQLKRLQVLYGQLARHTLEGADRDARLRWASELLGRPVTSFRDLAQPDAGRLIDTLQGQLGVKASPKRRKRLSREDAHKAGTEGRRGQEDRELTMAGPSEFARIQHALDLIGWNREQLEAWLRSPRSPLRHKSSPEIRTLGDANRVWWALKRMAIARGQWKGR
jgi:hypothetical protein